MKKFLLCLLASWALNATAAVSVIVHPSNADSIDESTIKRLFLGKDKSFPGGTSAEPINLADGSDGQSVFNDAVLSKSDSQVKAYWSKLLFTGKGTPPPTVDNDAAMLQAVASNPNAIGYITGDADGSVKVIGTF
ncbi:phosphate ABC transporter substrate-binding protein [Aestuariibacter salexigens]|uniref:phosphate ABC transporter substrate-binding protein n=1 Tax=Aestuariibacter salexigens TaxID=226010 RepID=UPI00040D5DCE|nr:phosphate ABC transporter substrate-binding protein [Aestuariibacter salexigens]